MIRHDLDELASAADDVEDLRVDLCDLAAWALRAERYGPELPVVLDTIAAATTARNVAWHLLREEGR